MSENGAKCKPAGFLTTKNAVLCNLSENEINHISMSDRHMPGEKHLGEENRWAIEFDHGNSQFVVYFTEEAANRFVEEINRSFGRSTNHGMGQIEAKESVHNRPNSVMLDR
jgi:hypothetical protein